MELISTVKMKKAADIAVGARPFAMEASSIFSRVAEEISSSPYVQSQEQKAKSKKQREGILKDSDSAPLRKGGRGDFPDSLDRQRMGEEYL